MTKDLRAFMPEALGYPYPEEALRAAQKAAEQLKSVDLSALTKYAEIAAKMAPLIPENNALWTATQRLNDIAEKFAPPHALDEFFRHQEELAQAYAASQRLFQQLTGDTWTAPAFGKPHRVQRIFENLERLGIDLKDYDSIPIKDFIKALEDRDLSEYEAALKEQFPKKSSSVTTEGRSLRADSIGLLSVLVFFNFLQGVTGIWADLVTIGLLPQLSPITELINDSDSKLGEDVEQHQKTKPCNDQLSNPRPRCGCDCKTGCDQNDEETSPTHEPTSTLI